MVKRVCVCARDGYGVCMCYTTLSMQSHTFSMWKLFMQSAKLTKAVAVHRPSLQRITVANVVRKLYRPSCTVHNAKNTMTTHQQCGDCIKSDIDLSPPPLSLSIFVGREGSRRGEKNKSFALIFCPFLYEPPLMPNYSIKQIHCNYNIMQIKFDILRAA